LAGKFRPFSSSGVKGHRRNQIRAFMIVAERGMQIDIGADVEQCLEVAAVAGSPPMMKCDGQAAEIRLQVNLCRKSILSVIQVTTL
jgi:hypothetical protein